MGFFNSANGGSASEMSRFLNAGLREYPDRVGLFNHPVPNAFTGLNTSGFVSGWLNNGSAISGFFGLPQLLLSARCRGPSTHKYLANTWQLPGNYLSR
jgi:hypothetical protein